MTDLEALQQLAVHVRHIDIPRELRDWLGMKQRSLQTAQPRRLAYAGPRGVFVAGPVSAPQTWRCRGVGAARLVQAALNPNQWIDLRAGRTRRAWHSAISDALDSLARIDSGLADAFGFGEYRDAPGTHLRERDGRIQMLWRPAPGLVVDVSSP